MNAIVAVDSNWAIGKGGDQLVYLSQDLQNFKRVTMGHPVILGRKTLATFPGGRPLKGRRNLVLSRSPDLEIEGAEVYHDLDSLLSAAPEDSFVIGGGSVYAALLPRCDTVYVTKIHHAFEGADTFFPDLDAHPDWVLAEWGEILEEKGYSFLFCTYRRR